MIEREVTIKNQAGIHARPAALIVQTAGQFSSKVYIEKDGERVNGKSIMGVIALGATHKTALTIITDGSDEREAADAIEGLFETKFGEE